MINHAQGHQMWELKILLDIGPSFNGAATLDGDLACLPQNWREKWQKWLQKHQLNPDLGQSWVYFCCNRYNYGNNMS